MHQHDGTVNMELEGAAIQRDSDGTVLPTQAKVKAKFTYSLGATLQDAVALHGEATVHKLFVAGALADLEQEAKRALRGSVRPMVEAIKPKALQGHMDTYKLGTDRVADAKIAKARAILEGLSPEERAALLQ